MKKTQKNWFNVTGRNFSFLIFLCLILLPFTILAQSENDFEVGLTTDGTGVLITGYIGRVTQVTIPSIIQGMPVKEISSRTFNRTTIGKDITSIVIPEGVTVLEQGIFEGKDRLRSVTLPSTLLIIGRNAFSGTAIASITIPEGVIEIGRGAFNSCRSLTSITLPKSLIKIDDAFDNSGITSIPENWPIEVTTIGGFSYSKLRTAVIPEGITHIASRAFDHCSDLTSIVLPSTITSIGANAFDGTRLDLATQAKLREFGYTGRL